MRFCVQDDTFCVHVKHDAEAERTRALGAEPCICDQGAAPLWLQRMNQCIDESRQVQAQAAERNRQWSEMGLLQRLGHEPLSQQQIQANCRKWGIKGQ